MKIEFEVVDVPVEKFVGSIRTPYRDSIEGSGNAGGGTDGENGNSPAR
jgi:hypothetical protein